MQTKLVKKFNKKVYCMKGRLLRKDDNKIIEKKLERETKENKEVDVESIDKIIKILLQKKDIRNKIYSSDYNLKDVVEPPPPRRQLKTKNKLEIGEKQKKSYVIII